MLSPDSCACIVQPGHQTLSMGKLRPHCLSLTIFFGLALPPLLLLLLGDGEEAALRPQDGVLVLGLHQEEVANLVLERKGQNKGLFKHPDPIL